MTNAQAERILGVSERMENLFQQHLALEAKHNGIHPDGCYYCGGQHSTGSCPNQEGFWDELLYPTSYDNEMGS